MCDPLITHIDEYHHFYCFISIPAKRGKVQINAARILPLVEFAVSQARPNQPWALGAQDFQSICGSGFTALRLFSLCMSTREHCMLSALATMVMHVLTCSPVFSAHDLIFCMSGLQSMAYPARRPCKAWLSFTLDNTRQDHQTI